MEQVDGKDWTDGYDRAMQVKLPNRRVKVAQNQRTKEWLLSFKRLVDGKVVKQKIRLTDEAMQVVVGLFFEAEKFYA